MHYYIDGYNLLFRVLRAGDNLTAQREFIIKDLSHKISFLEIDATLVFDAQYQASESTRSHSEALAIYFTEQGQTADDFILEEIIASPNPLEEVVITSDKGLAWRVRRKHGKTESVEEFITWLNKRYKNRIRQIREEQKHQKEVVTKPVLPKVSKLPQKNEHYEQCFQYYLEQFEKEFEELPADAVTEISNDISCQLPEKPKKKKKKEPEDHRTEMERWFDIFQKRFEDIK